MTITDPTVDAERGTMFLRLLLIRIDPEAEGGGWFVRNYGDEPDPRLTQNEWQHRRLHLAAVEAFQAGAAMPTLRSEERATLTMIDALRGFIETFGIDPFNLEYIIGPMKAAIDNSLNLGAGRLNRTILSSYLIDLTGLDA